MWVEHSLKLDLKLLGLEFRVAGNTRMPGRAGSGGSQEGAGEWPSVAGLDVAHRLHVRQSIQQHGEPGINIGLEDLEGAHRTLCGRQQ